MPIAEARYGDWFATPEAWNTRDSGWISVEDRLPEFDPEDEKPHMILAHRKYGRPLCGGDEGDKREVISAAFLFIDKDSYTHWQELPEDPT